MGEVILGVIGIVVSANSHNGFLLSLVIVLFFAMPFATIISSVIP